MNVRRLRAECVTCDAAYEDTWPVEHVRKIRSSIANRDIWIQSHCDTTGHPRFEVTDSTTVGRIVGRSNQMTLSEDPLYETFSLGPVNP